MKNYNPLEGQDCKFKIDEIYEIDKYGDPVVKKNISLDSEVFGYGILLKSITDKIDWIIEVGGNDYQGDYFFIGRDSEDNYYFANGGYGSCSGCDAFLACSELEDLESIRDSLKRGMIKFESKEDLLEYLKEEAKSSYWYYCSDATELSNELKKVLNLDIKFEDK